MPQSITIAAFALGAVLLLIALLGGGFKVFGAEVSGKTGLAGRSVAGILGVALLAFSIYGPKDRDNTNTAKDTDTNKGHGPTRDNAICVPVLLAPADHAVLPQRRLDQARVEAVWLFTWRACPEASRYHLFVIAPNAANPVVNDNSITSATYQYRRTHYGVTQREGWTWKVRAYVDGRWGDWSKERTFSVALQTSYRRMDFGFSGCDAQFDELKTGVSEADMVRLATAANAKGFAYHPSLRYGRLIIGDYPETCRSPANLSWPLYLKVD